MSSFFDAVAEIPKANYEDNTQFTHPDLEPYPVYLPHSSEGLPYTTVSSDLIPQLASLLTSATQISAKLRQQKTLAAEASAKMSKEEEEEKEEEERLSTASPSSQSRCNKTVMEICRERGIRAERCSREEEDMRRKTWAWLPKHCAWTSQSYTRCGRAIAMAGVSSFFDGVSGAL